MTKTNITSRDWYYLKNIADRKKLAESMEISEVHLRKTMTGQKRPGRYLAIKLELNTPYDRHYWRPDIFGTADQQEEVAA